MKNSFGLRFDNRCVTAIDDFIVRVVAAEMIDNQISDDSFHKMCKAHLLEDFVHDFPRTIIKQIQH